MEQKLFREELWESPKGILQLQVPPPHSSLLLIRSQGVYIIKIEAVGKEQEEKREEKNWRFMGQDVPENSML